MPGYPPIRFARVEPAGPFGGGVGLQRFQRRPSRFGGTATLTVTSRSPWPPLRLGTPRPRTRRMRPSAVPFGHPHPDLALQRGHRKRCTEGQLGEAHRHGHGQVVAVAAEHLVRPHVHGDVQVARRGAPQPGLTLAGQADALAVLDARGIRTLMVRVRVVTPVPRHSSQGCSMIEPLPRQSVHGFGEPERALVAVDHPGAVTGRADLRAGAGRAPLPWQLVHGAGLVSRSGMATPLVASRKSRSVSVSRSLPRRWLTGAAARPSEQPAEQVADVGPPSCPAWPNRSLRLNPPLPSS